MKYFLMLSLLLPSLAIAGPDFDRAKVVLDNARGDDYTPAQVRKFLDITTYDNRGSLSLRDGIKLKPSDLDYDEKAAHFLTGLHESFRDEVRQSARRIKAISERARFNNAVDAAGDAAVTNF